MTVFDIENRLVIDNIEVEIEHDGSLKMFDITQEVIQDLSAWTTEVVQKIRREFGYYPDFKSCRWIKVKS